MQIWDPSVGSWIYGYELNDPVVLCWEKRGHTKPQTVSTEKWKRGFMRHYLSSSEWRVSRRHNQYIFLRTSKQKALLLKISRIMIWILYFHLLPSDLPKALCDLGVHDTHPVLPPTPQISSHEDSSSHADKSIFSPDTPWLISLWFSLFPQFRIPLSFLKMMKNYESEKWKFHLYFKLDFCAMPDLLTLSTHHYPLPPTLLFSFIALFHKLLHLFIHLLNPCLLSGMWATQGKATPVQVCTLSSCTYYIQGPGI